MPPPCVACQLIWSPATAGVTGVPATAKRTWVGANFNTIRSVELRGSTATRFAAVIGAPHRVPQHQDEITSGTFPAGAATYARGGPASVNAAIRTATTARG